MWTFALTLLFYAILLALQIDQGKRINKIDEQLFVLGQKINDEESNVISENSYGDTEAPPDEGEQYVRDFIADFVLTYPKIIQNMSWQEQHAFNPVNRAKAFFYTE